MIYLYIINKYICIIHIIYFSNFFSGVINCIAITYIRVIVHNDGFENISGFTAISFLISQCPVLSRVSKIKIADTSAN